MISLTTIYTLTAIGAVGLVPVARHIYNRIRKNAKREVMDAVKDAFVVEMATNHLPHIYHALEVICKALNVELSEPPAIHFINLEGTNGTNQDSDGRTS